MMMCLLITVKAQLGDTLVLILLIIIIYVASVIRLKPNSEQELLT